MKPLCGKNKKQRNFCIGRRTKIRDPRCSPEESIGKFLVGATIHTSVVYPKDEKEIKSFFSTFVEEEEKDDDDDHNHRVTRVPRSESLLFFPTRRDGGRVRIARATSHRAPQINRRISDASFLARLC